MLDMVSHIIEQQCDRENGAEHFPVSNDRDHGAAHVDYTV